VKFAVLVWLVRVRALAVAYVRASLRPKQIKKESMVWWFLSECGMDEADDDDEMEANRTQGIGCQEPGSEVVV
jgi:hypothetical protein